VTELQDILEEYIPEKPESTFWRSEVEAAASARLSPAEETVLAAVPAAPVALDELVAATGLSAREINVALTYLELQGLVQRLPGGLYCRC
ncbi:MAG: DNA-protecting protein DprA, partial [Moorellaceae bacterium]